MPRIYLLLISSLLGGACAGASRTSPRTDQPAPPEPDADVLPRDSAADPGRANPPADAAPSLSPDSAPVSPADAQAPDLAPEPTGDGAVPADGPPASAGSYLVEGLTGDVTVRELDAFIATTAAASIPVAMWQEGNPGSHNTLSTFGRGGYTLEAINLLYEVAKDARLPSQQHRLLDLAIKWNDAWLVHRNDLPMGEKRVMWTGKVEPIWPPNHPADPEAKYAGSETADAVGMLAHTTLNVLRTSDLAAMTVPDGDPNHFGATYQARAKTYLAMLETSMDQFFVASFIDPATLTIRHPSLPAYDVPVSQNVNAWNRMMLFGNAFQTLGQVHALLGDDPAREARYRKIVDNIVDLFVKAAVPHAASDGTPVFDWGYGNSGDVLNKLSNEDLGHGVIDMIGLTRASRAGYGHATSEQLKTYASTVMHEIRIGPGNYAGSVNRSKATEMSTWLNGGWLTLSPYLPGLLQAIATDQIAAGQASRSASVAGYLLWAKHWAAKGALPPP
jgi:hypothetical protein